MKPFFRFISPAAVESKGSSVGAHTHAHSQCFEFNFSFRGVVLISPGLVCSTQVKI